MVDLKVNPSIGAPLCCGDRVQRDRHMFGMGIYIGCDISIRTIVIVPIPLLLLVQPRVIDLHHPNIEHLVLRIEGEVAINGVSGRKMGQQSSVS